MSSENLVVRESQKCVCVRVWGGIHSLDHTVHGLFSDALHSSLV